MKREQKSAVIDEVAAQIQEAEAVFAVDYRGISVPQAAELRERLREADASFRVVKNRLTVRSADKAGAESLKELLEGPTALTFVKGDAALAAKALSTFRRTTDLLEVKGGTMNGAPISGDDIRAIAALPGREQLQAQFVGVLASPITGLVRGLGSMIGGLAVALGEIRDRGLVTGEAPEAAAEPEPDATTSEEEPAEAPGDPVAEGEAAEEETAAGTAEEETSDDAPASEQGENEEG